MTENAEILSILREMRDSSASLNRKLVEHMEFEAHTDALVQDQLKELRLEISNLSVLLDAFPRTPDGKIDAAGHRQDHEQRRKSDRETAELLSKLKLRIAENITTAILFALVVIIGLGVKDWLVSYIVK